MTDKKDRCLPENCGVLACNCEKTMQVDGSGLGSALGLNEPVKVYTHLCRSQQGIFTDAISADKHARLIVTCTQEEPLFRELAEESTDTELAFVNIRENAGWSKSGKKATPKMAALIAEALTEVEPTGLLPIASEGACIVYGSGQQALETASRLADRLDVSLVVTGDTDVILPLQTTFPVYRGDIKELSGSLGNFSATISDFADLSPSSKNELAFENAADGVSLAADLVLDLSGKPLLNKAWHNPAGYFAPDPENSAAIATAMFDICDLVGEFEKPIYVNYNQSICAHSRSNQVGCSNCIDNCPTSAIKSSGEGIVVDQYICDGCGHCSSSCPTGAISYAYPDRRGLIVRAQAMTNAYLDAGGKNPVLLVHEHEHGGNLIAALARHGDGLEANILPLGVYSVTHIGHDSLAAILASGAQSVVILAPMKKRDELDALHHQCDLTNTFVKEMGFDEAVRVHLAVEDDPDLLGDLVNNIERANVPAPQPITPVANKRETARLALANLNAMAPHANEIIELPDGAPYGRISILKESCTLCLSCVSSCPAGALGDNEDRPQVSFTEASCVQCGLCRTICPEKVITLEPRYNFTKDALSPVVVHEDEPLECSRCGKPFGSRAAIDKVTAILEGKNPMFQSSKQVALLKMCDNCRVITISESSNDPMAMGTVPKTLTTDDYFPDD